METDSIAEHLPSVFNAAAYFLEENTRQRGEKIAFYHGDRTYTYAQVARSVRCAANFLSALGIEPENRVALLLPDSPDFVVAFWGAIWLGAVPVPINTSCSIDEIGYILRDCRAKALVTTQAWSEKLQRLAVNHLRQTILTDAEPSWLTHLAQQDEQFACAETSPDEPAFWLYTSGSTGRPKGVIHLHRSMVVCAERYGKAVLGLEESDIVYSIANLPFAYGLGNTLYMPMAVGAAAILSDASNAFEIIADVQRYRPTVLFGIPSAYAGLLAVHEIAPLDTSSLRLCVSAAEQLPKTLWYKWRETHHLTICEGIGTTELLHIFLSNARDSFRPGSSGRPVPGYRVQVVDSSGTPLPAGEIGDLQVTGESLMLGYWNRLQETRHALYGSTMRTGDKYLVDADGYFWFMGRQDDFFKVNGLWVSPFEIEDVLLQHEGVLDAAVVPDRTQELTQVIAYVSLKPGLAQSPELNQQIRQFAKARLPHFKAPKQIHILASLPRTATGKIHRKSLLKLT